MGGEGAGSTHPDNLLPKLSTLIKMPKISATCVMREEIVKEGLERNGSYEVGDRKRNNLGVVHRKSNVFDYINNINVMHH